MKSLIALMTAACLSAAVHAGEDTLVLSRSIDLPRVTGRIDHFGYDPAGKRLFVAALGNNTVEVIDLATGKDIHSITGLTEPQGIAYVASAHRLLIANGGDGSVRAYDEASFKQVGLVKFDDDADNVRLDGASGRLYVGYGDGGIGIIDPASLTTVGTIPLTAHPESFQLDPDSHRLFVNLPGSRTLAEVDLEKGAIAEIWKPSAGSNFPMALDAAHARIFVGCRSPAKLLVFDARSGRETTSLPLHHDCDDVFYDEARGRVYASCGEGFVDIFSAAADKQCAPLEAFATASKGRTSFLAGDFLYVGVPAQGGTSAKVLEYRLPRL